MQGCGKWGWGEERAVRIVRTWIGRGGGVVGVRFSKVAIAIAGSTCTSNQIYCMYV
jgi:hypothetical protein